LRALSWRGLRRSSRRWWHRRGWHRRGWHRRGWRRSGTGRGGMGVGNRPRTRARSRVARRGSRHSLALGHRPSIIRYQPLPHRSSWYPWSPGPWYTSHRCTPDPPPVT